MDDEKRKQIRWMFTIFGALALAIVFFFIIFRFDVVRASLNNINVILKPILYGAVIAYLLKTGCNFFEKLLKKHLGEKRQKFANAMAVTLCIILSFVIIYLLFIIIMPQVMASTIKLLNILPGKFDELYVWLQKVFDENTIAANYITEIYQNVQSDLKEWVTTVVMPNLQNVVSGVGVQLWNSVLFLKNIVIGLVVAVYLLLSRDKIVKGAVKFIHSIMKPKWADLVVEEIKFSDTMFVGFVNGKLLDSLIIGVICYVCCLIFKFPNAMLISVIVGVTNIIPFFGPFIGAIPSALLILIESPMMTVWFLLFILILQQIDGNIIGPKILGNTTGLQSFWVLFSIIVFGGLWGFIGMVIGVPLMAVLYDIVRKLVRAGLKKNGREDLLEEAEPK